MRSVSFNSSSATLHPKCQPQHYQLLLLLSLKINTHKKKCIKKEEKPLNDVYENLANNSKQTHRQTQRTDLWLLRGWGEMD